MSLQLQVKVAFAAKHHPVIMVMPGSNGDCSGDEGCGTADADTIVSDDTDGEDNENKSSSNEPGDYNDSAQSSEDNDNSFKDTTILIPTYVNTPDYDDICALKWGREHYLRFFPSMKGLPTGNELIKIM